MNILSLVCVLLLILSLPGCEKKEMISKESMKQYSIGHVGLCLTDEIKITKTTSKMSAWVAVCNGRKFACARSHQGNGLYSVKCSRGTFGRKKLGNRLRRSMRRSRRFGGGGRNRSRMFNKSRKFNKFKMSKKPRMSKKSRVAKKSNKLTEKKK